MKVFDYYNLIITNPVVEDRFLFSAPDIDDRSVKEIPVEELPRCKNGQCGGLLRPNVVWFGEGLDPDVLSKTG